VLGERPEAKIIAQTTQRRQSGCGDRGTGGCELPIAFINCTQCQTLSLAFNIAVCGRRPRHNPGTHVACNSSIVWAERVGFEPTELAFGCFQDSCLKPLGHLSRIHVIVAHPGSPPRFNDRDESSL
jgi:hypothetical protein